ncbi:unnamed protein product, partial [Linum tenue]
PILNVVLITLGLDHPTEAEKPRRQAQKEPEEGNGILLHRSKHEIHHGPHQLRGWSVRAYQPRRFGDTVVVQHVDKRVYPSRTNPDAQVGDSQRVPGIPDVLEESRLRAIAAGVACLPFRVPFNGVANKYRRIHLRG